MKLKNIICIAISCIGLSSLSFATGFKDVPKDFWGYDAISQMVELNVLTGYPDGSFAPQGNVTREEFATILTKVLKLEASEESNFEDVANDRWSKQYIDAASPYLSSYSKNGKDYFHPTEPALREDIAVAAVKAIDLNISESDTNILNNFSDSSIFSKDTKNYLATAINTGLMKGYTDGSFNPFGSLTRAEVAAFMCNILKMFDINTDVDNTTIRYGDVDGDGKVTSDDAILVKHYVEGKAVEINKKAADVFVDNKIEEYDAILILRHALLPDKYPIPHSCGGYKASYTKIDGINHNAKYVCNCGALTIDNETENHTYENGKCIYCNDLLIYGDVNGDGKVSVSDVTYMLRYEADMDGYTSATVNVTAADVFVDSNIDSMDTVVILRYIDGGFGITLPHTCGSYTATYSPLDTESHTMTFDCTCGNLSGTTDVAHVFSDDGICIYCSFNINEEDDDKVVVFYAEMTEYYYGGPSKINCFEINQNGKTTVNFIPDVSGYEVANVTVDGISLGKKSSYTFDAKEGIPEISVTYAPITD